MKMAVRYGGIIRGPLLTFCRPVNVTDEQLINAENVTELSMKRIKKDSFYWYSKLIKSNGKDWEKEMR